MHVLILILGALAAIAAAMNFAQAGYGFRDAALKQSKALPNGAAAATTDAIDLGHNATGSHLAPSELLISAPAVNSTGMPSDKTMTYAVVHSDNADMSNPVVLADSVIVQEGDDGDGAAAVEMRFGLPSDVKRYVAVRATGSAAGDASGTDFAVQLLA